MNGFSNDIKNAFRLPDNGLIQLILINVIIFVALLILKVFLVLSGSEQIYALIIEQLTLPSSLDKLIYRPWSVITYFFIHEGFLHILWNMLILYWFGKLIKDFLGNKHLVNLYIIGGLTGGVFYIIAYNLLPYFQDQVEGAVLLGASAGVFAVVVGAATYMPNYTFFLLFIGPVRIFYIAAFVILISIAGTIQANAGGNIAHLGGALIGYIFIRQLQKGNDLGKPVTSILEGFKSFFTREAKIKVTHTKKSIKKTPRSDSDQTEIDAILDKISESGYEKLTKEEKQKLFNASRKK